MQELEEGTEPSLDFEKLRKVGSGEGAVLPVVLQHAENEAVLFVGYANRQALQETLARREAVLWSTSRNELWHKGATSGLVQKVVEIRIDDDQDSIWLRVDVAGGASCHVGYRSCFYRSVPFGTNASGELAFEESEKVFDPAAVYGDAPNPTRL